MATKKEMAKYREKLEKIPPNIKGIPFSILNVEECLELVKASGFCLRYIPIEKRTREICIAAVKRAPAVLQYVSEQHKTIELYVACYEGILNNSFQNLEYADKVSHEMPKLFHKDKRIIKLERSLNIRKIETKIYQDGKFQIVESLYNGEKLKKHFTKFIDFYTFVDGDLSGANLLEYDFSGINMKVINISDALICADILKANDMYDDTYYKTNIKIPKENVELVPYEPQEITSEHYFPSEKLSDDVRRIYYISDIHLNHKLAMKFSECATENEIKYYVKKLADELMESCRDMNENDFIMIAGDVSYNYRIAELFYSELVKKLPFHIYEPKMIVVLGNHDLWNLGSKERNRYDLHSIIEKYRKLFEKLGIIFLQNDLLIVTGDYPYCSKINIITEKEILSNNKEWLQEKCINSRLTVLGGIGFTGENDNFNATDGIYRNTITSLEDDKEYTKEFNDVYNKVREAMGTSQVVVLTHTALEDWNPESQIPNWIYVNGHTHKNYFNVNGEGKIYADNQSGYKNQNMKYKSFELSTHYDIFHYYEDGIYNEISEEKYVDFYRGIKKSIQTNSIANGQIIMLKKAGVYFFLYRENNKLYYLEGGQKRKLKEQSVNYYYNTMLIYQNGMKSIMKDYYEKLKFLSTQIKKIGGEGRIHGCIVDIDYYNHIFYFPSGEIKAYWAEAKSNRVEYSSVEKLLEKERTDLYYKYLENKNELQFFSQDELSIQYEEDAVEVIGDTQMYTGSNLFRKIQYMYDVNIIREWDEKRAERILFKSLNSKINTDILTY